MCNIWLLFSMVTLAFQLSLVNSQAVCSPSGWFGPRCQYKCHCENDQCNSSTGQCTDNSKCVSGWFGLGCQYEDLINAPSTTIISSPDQASSTWITDGDDSTCNQDINLQSMVVKWNITYPFSWLRLTVKDNAYPGHFKVSFKANGNDEIDCSYQQTYVIDQKTVDISCNMTVDVMQVIIRGQSVTSLCSLYISGGQNEALKQTAVQSSTYINEGIDLGLASHAVDGNTNSFFYSKTCTHTNDPSPNWKVAFSQPQAINRIVLYNRFDSSDKPCCPERLIHFGLQTFNASNKTMFSYQDPWDIAMLIYTVIVPISQRNIPISGIFVNSSEVFLTLCELQAFEECANGLWGLDCNNTCNTSCKTSCHVETGFCPSCNGSSNPPSCNQGCISGQWGLNCKQNCSINCYNQSCNTQTGVCDKGCNGYSDSPNCSIQCVSGKWGLNCTQSCSSSCYNKSCNSQTGVCDVGCNGYSDSPNCSIQCISTEWGLNCNNSCNVSCYNSHCDRHSGMCSQGCDGYNNPPTCTIECTPGTWGKNCMSLCSIHCSNTSCDRHSGKCNQGCNGYDDFPDCTESITKANEDPSTTTVIGLGIGLGVACAIIIALLIVIFMLKRKQPLTDIKRDTVNYDTVAPAKEYSRQYETPEATAQYQNTAKKYRTNEDGTLKQSNVKSGNVYDEDTTATNEYESIGLDKIDSVS
ncbi:unnamed protein product [Lymnaea stagnalis]|uniref:Fucolectin tachylectin-4 pentraxin-1 domain-containing protein n=1 Tax=Lymnaea stagnalis TaxID=6523 RepID=A0AAV2HPD1_LYMST